MLAHPLEGKGINLDDYAAEWKWDGIRVQIVRGGNGGGGETRLYSRGGEEIGAAFPELVAAFDPDAVIDRGMLVPSRVQGGEAASFNELQQRLRAKTVTQKRRADTPPFVRLNELLDI